MARNVATLLTLICAALSVNMAIANARDAGEITLVAANGGDDANAKGDDKKREKTPQEKMQARFPQPVKVGHLIGLPLCDENDSTIGYVQQVVRTNDDRIQLVVPYAKRFGWMRNNALVEWSRRPVAVPIEVVAILALQINALEMDRVAFDNAPMFDIGQSRSLPPDETIKIALGRR